ncbi:hypothetical protein PFISCL1PPCAC_24195, partial [Pristionchus fissidentatus]
SRSQGTTTSDNGTTCGQNLTDCIGHFEYIDLTMPVFHVGFFRMTIQMLQCICKGCSSLLLSGDQRESFMKQVSNPNLDYLRRKALHKKIVATSKKISICVNCGAKNGVVKKAVGAVLKIVHSHSVPADQEKHYVAACEDNAELATALHKGKFTLLSPLAVHKILSNVDERDIPLLMVRSGERRSPGDVLITKIPVPPNCIRSSVVSEVSS